MHVTAALGRRRALALSASSEAATQAAADDLAHEAAMAVFELAGGVGAPPTKAQ